MTATVQQFREGSLSVSVYTSEKAMGDAAGARAAAELSRLLDFKDSVRVMFAAAPSQECTLAALSRAEGIDWSRVEAFHMDEYVGLGAEAPQSFANWLDSRVFRKLPFRTVHRLGVPGIDPDDVKAVRAESQRYAALLDSAPLDLVLAGIGMSTHLAFNDPPVRFDGEPSVRVVELGQTSRTQQVEEGLFPALENVPRRAWTVTMTCLLSAGSIVCTVPGKHKRDAVKRTLECPVSGDVPASALRVHPCAALFLDEDSFPGRKHEGSR